MPKNQQAFPANMTSRRTSRGRRDLKQETAPCNGVRLCKDVLNENGLTGIEMSWLSVFSFLIGAEFTSGLRVPMYKSLKG